MTKYKAVLFDLDGTLLDTANDLGESLNHVLSRYELPQVAREDYRPVASDGAKGLLELGFKSDLANYDFNELRNQFLDYYQTNIAVHTSLYDGIAELISHLESKDIPWGIVTNKPIGLTKQLLPSFAALDGAGAVLGGDSLPERKPHPAPLIEAARQLGVAPQDCIYVGDAPRDIEAANAANMFSIIAKWGYIINPEDCLNWGANKIIDAPLSINTYV